jgi:ABC-type multidrug transport system fused ATPase/permease subunit
VFLAVVILSNLIDALKDYRQRLLNVRVMISLRHSLFDRMLHLPLPKVWDMKTGGILSRLTGDIDTTGCFSSSGSRADAGRAGARDGLASRGAGACDGR